MLSTVVLGLGSKWEKLRETLLELTVRLQLFISFRGTDGKFLVATTTNDFLSRRKGQKYVHISVHKYVVVVLLGVSGGAKY